MGGWGGQGGNLLAALARHPPRATGGKGARGAAAGDVTLDSARSSGRCAYHQFVFPEAHTPLRPPPPLLPPPPLAWTLAAIQYDGLMNVLRATTDVAFLPTSHPPATSPSIPLPPAVVVLTMLKHTEPSAEHVRTALLVLAHVAATQPHYKALSEKALKVRTRACTCMLRRQLQVLSPFLYVDAGQQQHRRACVCASFLGASTAQYSTLCRCRACMRWARVDVATSPCSPSGAPPPRGRTILGNTVQRLGARAQPPCCGPARGRVRTVECCALPPLQC